LKNSNLSDYVGGWFIGDFSPSLIRTDKFEVAVKRFRAGDTEPMHYQLTAIEITVVVSGRCRIGSRILSESDIVEIGPFESVGFEALTDVILVAVKTPSLPDDKVLGSPTRGAE